MTKTLTGLIGIAALLVLPGATLAGSQTLPGSVCSTADPSDEYFIDAFGRFAIEEQGGARVHCPIVREKFTGSKITALEIYLFKANRSKKTTCRVRTMDRWGVGKFTQTRTTNVRGVATALSGFSQRLRFTNIPVPFKGTVNIECDLNRLDSVQTINWIE